MKKDKTDDNEWSKEGKNIRTEEGNDERETVINEERTVKWRMTERREDKGTTKKTTRKDEAKVKWIKRLC
jgi:hypothetical protein